MADTLVDSIARMLGGDFQAELGRQLGVDGDVAGRLVQSALPTILTGLQRNSRQPEGAEALHDALSAKHDGSVLDDLMGYMVAGGDAADGSAILGHIFGRQEKAVTTGVSQVSSVDSKLLKQAMAILAPIVLGFLGKRMRSESLDSGGLSDVLARGGTAPKSEPGMPDLGSVLGSILGGMGQSGGQTAKSSATSGLLGKLLASLIGRGR